MLRLTVVAALLLPVSLGATVLVPIEFRELVTTAPVIVRGRVVDVHPAWVDGRRAVETFVTVQAAEYLKGNLGSEVVIRVPGGQLGRYRTVFVGAPTFADGDDVLLFLKSSGSPYPFIVGLSQGAYRIVTPPGSSTPTVTQPILMGQLDGDPVRVIRGDVARRPVSVDRFRDTVRQVLAEASGR